jgi:hypothetical protein
MGWIRDRLFGGQSGGRQEDDGSDSESSELLCDCCNAPLERADTYYLPTRTVMISEAHWADTFTMNRKVWALFLSGDQLQSAFSDFVRQHAASNTPWAVCERCSEFFIFDRAAARENALNDRAPDDGGAVDPAGCVLFAALGWERVYGSWPEAVKRPEVADVCDFCKKKMYVGELDGFVSQATLERYEANGFTDHDRPVGKARTRDGETGWVECQVCMARNLTRGQRANYRPDHNG